MITVIFVIIKLRADEEIRTPDLYFTRVLLYQLSYIGEYNVFIIKNDLNFSLLSNLRHDFLYNFLKINKFDIVILHHLFLPTQ